MLNAYSPKPGSSRRAGYWIRRPNRYAIQLSTLFSLLVVASANGANEQFLEADLIADVSAPMQVTCSDHNRKPTISRIAVVVELNNLAAGLSVCSNLKKQHGEITVNEIPRARRLFLRVA